MLQSEFTVSPEMTYADEVMRNMRWEKTVFNNFTFSPAARITSCPSSAGFLLPETGASRKEPPFDVIACTYKKPGLKVMNLIIKFAFYVFGANDMPAAWWQQ